MGFGIVQRTRLKARGDSIKHVGVHVRVDSPVRGSVIPGGDENRVTLSDSKTD